MAGMAVQTEARGRGQRTGRARFVVALLTVIVLSGAASAAAGGLITGIQIKDGTIRSRDLTNAGLTGADVRDASLSVLDFDQDSIRGPQGDDGPQGAPGPRGLDGIPGVEFAQKPFTAVHEESGVSAGISGVALPCPTPSKRAVAGGISSLDPDGLDVIESAPIEPTSGNNGRWEVTVHNGTSADIAAFAWVTCVTP
jgi:hypothetical protein